ncbi:MAG: bifunctional methylenetetrahydrofolate dehydrogenase/methenyltetrahydrofolate cyclohydrolase FolD [Deltaproteobacteria bacterium]|jgi:methylenetetrahydrofolate dehydrogenase (NADP+) / methenyltetrahydrofolate cyclohydrolase|nr:bifunctional methylenetetrahydrofolate dehydrogenase/methenyltetrahydrofolate cyclohydrolase FolD [Deltaproteobacteria bacterium]MBT4643509.1 bifunctional methylenetetrahydrofolate dehydrogenase/methenyltetrahydrofolate cyclohydrolase FolD [Deltaproteobacteria bacterium]MBT6503373.1 bifunctional methylenetetrahydrofolate dehydrogenase/methenyltetrahydrofolate cyclohydrolase FolD [Deltaproteobacteria bacterium]MBT7151308.1 bifunctional methylenetetrahydrofolate dehydrogenase/methenyltetrahydro
MKRLSGTEISKQIKEELKKEVISLKAQGVRPKLAVILVGDDPGSAIYVNSKKRTCAELGFGSLEKKMSADTTQSELLSVVNELNNDPSVNGILCQVPLPEQCDEQEVIQTIDPDKDVDCFHPYNLGLLTAGMPKFMPCTPFGVLQILKRSDYNTSGKNVVVLGRSNIVGRPLSILMSLKEWNATVTVCHSRTQNLPEVCATADILIVAIGRANFVTAEFVKKGAVVIDVGMNRIEDATHPKGSRLAGDVDYAGIEDIAAAATPVPGGVGPMTIAMLMYNTINAARFQAGMERFEL